MSLLLEAQGMDMNDPPAIGEALVTLENDLGEYITPILYAALKEVDVNAANELDARIEQGITYDDVYDLFAQKLPACETELAKALVAFARQKLTPAQFYTWNTFLYRFTYMYHEWMVITDFINDLLREQKSVVVIAENFDSVQDALYQQFYQQFYIHYIPTLGSPWKEEFTERDEKGEFPSYQSVFEYFTRWSKTLKTDLVSFLVAFREEYLRKDQEAAKKQNAEEEINALAERVQRDRKKAIYTFSMSTLNTLPLTTHEDKNNKETQEEIYQDANMAVILHLATCLGSSTEKQQAKQLLESGAKYDEIYEFFETHQLNLPVEVAKALLAFRMKKQKQAIEKKFREVRRIKSRINNGRYTDEQIAVYVEQLHTIWLAFRKDYTGQEQFGLFFDDPEVQANFDDLLDKGMTANDILESIYAWYEVGNHLLLRVHYVSPFTELINRLLA
jgi:hypothetical protein